jgi:hypothetical protein
MVTLVIVNRKGRNHFWIDCFYCTLPYQILSKLVKVWETYERDHYSSLCAAPSFAPLFSHHFRCPYECKELQIDLIMSESIWMTGRN